MCGTEPEATLSALVEKVSEYRRMVRPLSTVAAGLAGPQHVCAPTPSRIDEYRSVVEQARHDVSIEKGQPGATRDAVASFLDSESEWLCAGWDALLLRSAGEVRSGAALGLVDMPDYGHWLQWAGEVDLSSQVADVLRQCSSASELVQALQRVGVDQGQAGAVAAHVVETARKEFVRASERYGELQQPASSETSLRILRGDADSIARRYFDFCAEFFADYGLSTGRIVLGGPVRAIDAMYLPSAGPGGTVLVGEQFGALGSSNHPIAPFGALALLAHEGYPGHAFEFDLFSEQRTRPFRLMRDRARSEGWACLAEHFPSVYLGEAGLERGVEAVLRRTLTLLLRNDPREALSLVHQHLTEERAEVLIRRARRTRTPQEPYVMGFAHWRAELGYDFEADFDWPKALRTMNDWRNWLALPGNESRRFAS